MRGNETVSMWKADSVEVAASSSLKDYDEFDTCCQHELADATVHPTTEEPAAVSGTAPADSPDTMEPVSPPDPFIKDMHLVAVERDREAYTRIFRHFAPRLMDFSRRQMVSDQQAMELVQETMLIVWKKAHLYDHTRASTTTWIYRICRNLRFDMLRKQFQLKDEISADDLWPSLEEAGLISTQGGMYRKVAAEQVLRYYRKLPAPQQEIVRMLYLEEKSHQEVADELDIPLGTVKSRIRLAINRLKQFIDSHD